ncbi:MAG: hypothetical protein FRX49_07967, partial [Trebouxia sp. A1-2]
GGVAAQLRPRPADLEKALRSCKIAYYSQCDLLVFQQHKSGAHHFKGGHGKGRFKKSKADDSSDEETGKAEAASVFLHIQSGQERPIAYQRDDIWVLSSDPFCQVEQGSGAPWIRAGFCWPAVPGMAPIRRAGAQTAKAIPADATVSVSQNLKGSTSQLLDEHARRIAAEFQLNTDQVAVLVHCSRWASADKDASPVCIIHGPFGCGKSSLLVALIHYLLAQRSQQGSGLKGCRVLLSAHTNIAVDRLMTGLQDTGCTDMVRVGALRRISKTLLPHSLHAVDSKAKSDAVSELKEMRAGTSNTAEAAIIQRELDQLKQ